MTTQNRGADLVARTLARAGVSRVFSLSGNHIMSIYDAGIDAGLEIIHVRHEAAAVHMADAWARLTGKIGVAMLTGGPGHANGVAALYTALASESPVLLLSGHAPLEQLGQGAFQEMRQADMAAPVTKASWTVAGIDTLAEDVARAIRIATSGRPGPVHLSLPDDVLEAVATEVELPPSDAFNPVARTLPDNVAREMTDALRAARRPLILAGPMGATALAGGMVDSLRAATGIPVVTMESPRGVNDPLLGAFAEVLDQADCVLLLGKQPDHTLGFGRPPLLSPDCQLLQIDPDELALDRLRGAFGLYQRLPRQFRADARSAARALADTFGATHPAVDWREEVEAAVSYRPAEWAEATGSRPGVMHPARLCAAVQPLLDSHPDAVLISDGGEFGQWAQACLSARHRVINGVAGAIGAGLSFALAARLAVPEAPVVALSGDGSIGFHISEFDTGFRHSLPFIAVVGNDSCWNAEYQIQLRKYGPDRAVGCELLPARYDRVAMALGGFGEQADDEASLASALQRAHESGLPACINVPMDRVPAPVIRRR